MYLWEGGRLCREEIRGHRGLGLFMWWLGQEVERTGSDLDSGCAQPTSGDPGHPAKPQLLKGYKTLPNTIFPAAVWSVGEEVFYI